MRKTLQLKVAFGFGIVFVAVLLVLAIAVPNPTRFQYLVFRVVLSLAMAGVAAMIPGVLTVSVPNWLRAGGALAVFIVVYFYNPASLIVPEIEPNQTGNFSITLVCKTQEQENIRKYSLPVSDIKKNAKHDAIIDLISKLPNQECSQTGSSIYRMRDQMPVLPDGDTTATSGNNLGIVVYPKNVADIRIVGLAAEVSSKCSLNIDKQIKCFT